ncbi:MAG TPA: endonuclease/exonuclease/phosphatase family protein [Bryobacteraceae bacterium]|nr:endonuclease/exonuclease/phosphatase family protein [Bryobacteraceae bacterium]
MSINLAAVDDANRIAKEITERSGGTPDILLLQEVIRRKGAQASVAEELAVKLRLHAAFAAPDAGATNVGVAILSRWPITNKNVKVVPRFYKLVKIRPRLALGVTAHTPHGSIRVWTTHLDTRITVEERLRQLEPILSDADAYRGPSIIGGDLNTLSLNWILHSVPYPTGNAHARAVLQLMQRHGFETPFREDRPTYDRFGLQLDWVYLRGLQATKSGIEPLAFSDHHAVWTEFVRNNSVPKAGLGSSVARSRTY